MRGELPGQVSVSKGSTVPRPSSCSCQGVRRACWELLPEAVITALLPPRGGFPVHSSEKNSGFGGLGVVCCLENANGVHQGKGVNKTQNRPGRTGRNQLPDPQTPPD